MDEPPTCPACGAPTYRIDNSYDLGTLRVRNLDPTWRHLDDGTVAVDREGTVVCERRDT